MAKFTRIELTPDDPIFWGRSHVFAPVSRPSMKNSQKSTDPDQSFQKPLDQESKEWQKQIDKEAKERFSSGTGAGKKGDSI